MLRTWIRRTVKAALVGAMAALVAAWFRDREEESAPEAPGDAEWPPLDVPPETAPAGSAAPAGAAEKWVHPDAEGDCPSSHPVKLKISSGIYHEPGGASYDRTNADRCYCTAEDAAADGFRASKT